MPTPRKRCLDRLLISEYLMSFERVNMRFGSFFYESRVVSYSTYCFYALSNFICLMHNKILFLWLSFFPWNTMYHIHYVPGKIMYTYKFIRGIHSWWTCLPLVYIPQTAMNIKCFLIDTVSSKYFDQLKIEKKGTIIHHYSLKKETKIR